MKRVVLVIGLVLLAGALFAAGPHGGAGAGAGKTVQAQTGDCDSDCDGPDQIRDRLQLKDGSCKDDATAVAASVLAVVVPEKGDRAQDQQQLKDGTGDPTEVPDQTRDRLSRPF